MITPDKARHFLPDILITGNIDWCGAAAKVIITVNQVEVLNRVYEGSGSSPIVEITAPANSNLHVNAEIISSSTPNVFCVWSGEVKLELYSNCKD